MASLPKGCWPAAKYLSYGFWRSWILVMYSAPLWGFFADGLFREAWRTMYAWSTASFVVVSVVLALRYRSASRLLARPLVMMGFGALASAGVLLEYVACAVFSGSSSAIFTVGAILSGMGTAFVAVRAGEIYAEASAPTAVTNTALCEVASGLIYFLVLGTIPEWALVIAALLPLAAAVMALFDNNERHFSMSSSAQSEARRRSIVSFVRFLLVVFVLTFAANAARSMVSANAPADIVSNDAAAVTVVVLVAFVIAAASSLFQSFRFGIIYYPLVLTLAGSLMLVFFFGFENSFGAATMLAVYSLFSMFMWCVLAYIAHGRIWDPIQVFGWGRAVFAIGGLLGMIGGSSVVIPSNDPSAAVLIGMILAFVVLASAMLVFRESDVMKIIDGRMMEDDARGRDGSVNEPSDLEAGGRGAASGWDELQGSDEEERAAAPVRPVDPQAYANEIGLTSREREVLPLMLEGRDARSIGEALVISENTAKAHIRNIYAKVGARNRREFVEATRHVAR